MTAFWLKIIAYVAMLMDHSRVVFPQFVPPIFSAIGRVAMPLYFYMAAVGCKHTHNIWRYFSRLIFFAVITEIPFDWAFHSHLTASTVRNLHLGQLTHLLNFNFFRSTSALYTISAAVACVIVYEEFSKRRLWLSCIPLVMMLLVYCFCRSFHHFDFIMLTLVCAYLLWVFRFVRWQKVFDTRFGIVSGLISTLPVVALAYIFEVDYGLFGISLIVMLYIFDPDNKINRSLILTAEMISLYGAQFVVDFLKSPADSLQTFFSFFFSMLAVLLVFLYKGKRGKQRKWSFYVLYTLHTVVLLMVNIFLHIRT